MPQAQATMRQFRSQSLGGYSRRDGDDLGDAVYALSGPLLLITAISLLHTSASIDTCVNFLPIINATCTEINGYSVALGLISTIFLFGFFIIFSLEKYRDRLPEKSLYYLSIGLLIWWGLGVAITTFQVTTIPDTRYFSVWMCFILSAHIARSEFEQFAMLLDKIKDLNGHARSIFYLCLASLVVTVSSVFTCVDLTCEAREQFGIAIGSIGFLLAIGLLRLHMVAEDIATKLAVFIAVLWFFSLCVLSLLGPFRFGSNGFFGTWACFLLSFYIAHGMCFPFSKPFGSMTSTSEQNIQSKNKLQSNNPSFGRDGDLNIDKKTRVFFVSSPTASVNGSASTMKAESIADEAGDVESALPIEYENSQVQYKTNYFQEQYEKNQVYRQGQQDVDYGTNPLQEQDVDYGASPIQEQDVYYDEHEQTNSIRSSND